MTKKIKVLVIDDSFVFREVISRGISSNSMIEVIGIASNPLEAMTMLLEQRPDVMTCDIEMPKMNGIDFIKNLLPNFSIPVIIVSSVTDAVFDALNAGAVEFIAKPDTQNTRGVEDFLLELISKIKIAAESKIVNLETKSQLLVNNLKENKGRVIAIGSSTGGTEALYQLLRDLPVNVPGIVIVQHIPPAFSKMFAERLDTQTDFTVKEAETGDIVEPGKVFIAPGNFQMRIKKVGDQIKIECFKGDKVEGHCPSVDVLFNSVAKEIGGKAMGVILTGMGYDGAKGLLSIKRRGGYTLGQDERTSVVYGMPKVAYNIGAVAKQAPLHELSRHIVSALKECNR